MEKSLVDDPIGAVALLEEPNRRRLYELVSGSREAVGRDQAASSLGVSRELAAFHLDRLVEGGLLVTEYRRLGGRRGPGAGRPSKLYRRASADISISLPPRRYELAADVLATALERLDRTSAADAVSAVGYERGRAVGLAARRRTGIRPGRRLLLAALVEVLRGTGYEPEVDAGSGTVCLRNCPYDDLVAEHRDLACGMNKAWAEGLVESIGTPARVELAPEPGRCCVLIHPAPGERPGRSQA